MGTLHYAATLRRIATVAEMVYGDKADLVQTILGTVNVSWGGGVSGLRSKDRPPPPPPRPPPQVRVREAVQGQLRGGDVAGRTEALGESRGDNAWQTRDSRPPLRNSSGGAVRRGVPTPPFGPVRVRPGDHDGKRVPVSQRADKRNSSGRPHNTPRGHGRRDSRTLRPHHRR